ncbi:MAG: hypothetical protein U1E87_09580 [Alphaproteobacteria bacterium]
MVERFRALGLTPVVAVELEFYLIEKRRGPGREPIPARDPASGEAPVSGNVYEIGELTRFACSRGDRARGRAQRLPVLAASAEYSPGQSRSISRTRTIPPVPLIMPRSCATRSSASYSVRATWTRHSCPSRGSTAPAAACTCT